MKTPYGDTPKNAKTRIRDARKARGWTINDLADALSKRGHKVTAQAIQRWETSTRSISVERLLVIAEALDVPPADLLPGGPPRMTEEEADWLDWFRSASSLEKRSMRALRSGLNDTRAAPFEIRKLGR